MSAAVTKPESSELRVAFEVVKPFLARAFVFGMISNLLILAPTFYMFEVYGRVVNSRNEMTLLMLTLLVLFVYVVMEVTEWVRSETLRSAGRLLDQRVAPRVFDLIFQANLKRIPAGGAQPMSDWRTVRDFFHAPVVAAIIEAPAALVFLFAIYLISPIKGTLALSAGVVMAVLSWLNQKRTARGMMEAGKASIAAQQYADGTLRNAEVIESMGMVKNIHRRWLVKQKEFLSKQAQASEHAGLFMALSKFIQTGLSSAMLGVGAWLMLQNLLPGGGGVLIVASVLAGRVVSPMVQLVMQWRAVVGAREAWMRLEDLFIQLPAAEPAMPLPAPKGELVVENLVAVAPGGAAIVRGVQFALHPGEVLAVVGPSGAGKTSLARALVGLWPSQAGKVRLDGVDVHIWDKRELGPYVGYLPQTVELLEGTLADNIARFGEVSRARLDAAARAVGLHDMIETLPQGYDTPVGADGARLSGGQRQRVALARALYGDPVLLVLDEPNASLDEAGDQALSAAILAAKSMGTTVVVMTHRSSILSVADKMLVLRDGTQQFFGPRDEVLRAIEKSRQAPVPGQAQASLASPRVSAP